MVVGFLLQGLTVRPRISRQQIKGQQMIVFNLLYVYHKLPDSGERQYRSKA